MGRDPTGNFSLVEEEVTADVSGTLDEIAVPELR